MPASQLHNPSTRLPRLAAGWLAGPHSLLQLLLSPAGPPVACPGQKKESSRAGGEGWLPRRAQSTALAPQAALASSMSRPAAQIWTRGVPAESGRLNYFCTNILLNVVVKLLKAFSCRGFYLDGRKSIIVTSSCAGRRLIHILTKLNVFILFRNFKYFSFREHQPSQTNKQILRQQFSSDQFFVWMN